ncbi:MAG: hypothetical protein ACR2LU_12470 [Luteitalea sp.]
MHRLGRWLPGLALSCAALLVAVAGAQTPAPPGSQPRRLWSVPSSGGTQPLPVSTVNGRDYVSAGDLTGLFGLTLREDRAGGLVLTMGARSIVVSVTEGLASVEGRVVSLPAPPVQQGASWLLPIEIIDRALAPGANPRIDVRRRSSLIVVGSLTVPAVTARSEPLPNGVRVVLSVSPAVSHTVVN